MKRHKRISLLRSVWDHHLKKEKNLISYFGKLQKEVTMCMYMSVQEFYSGKKDLSKFNTDIESFICALMPGSSSVQIRTTPGTLLSFLKHFLQILVTFSLSN